MARVILVEASPREPASGTPVAVRLAGGGARHYTHKGRVDWLGGVAAAPLVTSLLGFDGGFTGGAIPTTTAIGFMPADGAVTARIARLAWTGAEITISSADDVGAPVSVEQRWEDAGRWRDRAAWSDNAVGTAPGEPAWQIDLAGTVAGYAFIGGTFAFTVSDLAGGLAKPVAGANFAGTGGLEGLAEAAGRIKRRSWGRCWNVEGRLLDKANAIYEFGDPSRQLRAFDAVKDRGRAGPLLAVAWAGSPEATLAALIAAAAPAGGAAIAPSIACVKWWTTPAGPLTADLRGEIADGYVETVGAIAARISAACDGPPVAELAALTTARPDPAGLHVDSASETGAQALDRLLLSASIAWGVDPAGTLEATPIAFADPVETLAALNSPDREAAWGPVTEVAVGYERNHRRHTDAEISAAILASDVLFEGDTSLEEAVREAGKTAEWDKVADPAGTKPDNNATNGADPASPFGPEGTIADELARRAAFEASLRVLNEETIPAIDAAIDAAGQQITTAGERITAARTELGGRIDGARQEIAAERERAVGAEGMLNERISNVIADGTGYDDAAIYARVGEVDRARVNGDLALGERIDTVQSSYARGVTANSDFAQGGAGWSKSGGWSFPQVPTGRLARTSAGTYEQLNPVQPTKLLDLNRGYRLHCTFRVVGAAQLTYVGLQLHRANGVHRGNVYAPGFAQFLAPGTYQVDQLYKGVQPGLPDPCYEVGGFLAEGAAYAYPLFLANYPDGVPVAGGYVEIESFWLEDVGEARKVDARVTTEVATLAAADKAIADRTTVTEAQLRGDQESPLLARVRGTETAVTDGRFAAAGRVATVEARLDAVPGAINARVEAAERASADATRAVADRATTLEAVVRKGGREGEFDSTADLRRYWSRSHVADAGPIDPRLFVGSAWDNASCAIMPGGAGADIFSVATYPVDTSRRYRLKVRIGCYHGVPVGPTPRMYVGVVCLDGTGAYLDHGAYGSYRYSAVPGVRPAVNTISEYVAVMTGEGNTSLLRFAPGTKQVRLVILLNQEGDSSHNSYVDYIRFADVEGEEVAADARARVALTETALSDGRFATAQRASDIEALLGDARGRLGTVETATTDGRFATSTRAEQIAAEVFTGPSRNALLAARVTNTETAVTDGRFAAASRVGTLEAEYGGTKATVAEQAGVIVGLGQRTAAYWRVGADAGNGRRQLSVWADANGGGGVDIIGDVRISGDLLVGGSVTSGAMAASSVQQTIVVTLPSDVVIPYS